LVEDSDLLKNGVHAIMYQPDVYRPSVREAIAEAPSSPDNVPQKKWSFARGISAILKKNGVNSQVLKGNGSTSPSGSDKAKNYFIVEPFGPYNGDKSNKLYYNFDMEEENAKAIVAVLEKEYIPFMWSGGLGSSFVFVMDGDGNPE
jgi:hypothetical protein